MASYALLSHGPVPVEIRSVTLKATGSGNDSQDITKVRIWSDADADGHVGGGDVELGSGTYASDDGSLEILLDTPLVLSQLVPASLLVTYDFAPQVCPGSVFGLTLEAGGIHAVRTDTADPVTASAPAALPLAGRTVTQAHEIFSEDFEGGLDRWTVVSGDPVPDPGYGWQIRDTVSVSPAQRHDHRGPGSR